MYSQWFGSVSGTQFDPTQLATAVSATANSDYSNPQVQALVGQVAPSILSWFDTAQGASSTARLYNSPQFQATLSAINNKTETPTQMSQLGYAMTLMFDADNGIALDAQDKATLGNYGIDTSAYGGGGGGGGGTPDPALMQTLNSMDMSSATNVVDWNNGSPTWSANTLPSLNNAIGSTITAGNNNYNITSVSTDKPGFQVSQVDANGNTISTGELYMASSNNNIGIDEWIYQPASGPAVVTLFPGVPASEATPKAGTLQLPTKVMG
jgi:hypothetical protein